MTILSQDLFDTDRSFSSLKDKETYEDRWNTKREKLFSEIQQLCKKFEIDQPSLLRYLKDYCTMNGLVVGRCMLSKDQAVIILLFVLTFRE
jgi:hypothetical protein